MSDKKQDQEKHRKFDVIIGNPPFQDDTIGDNKTYAPPMYHKFIDQAYKISNIVELIHPGRFLFNAGSTPKPWNRKMLSDEHVKVLFYEQDSSKVFYGTDIKGGVAVTYFDKNKTFTPIGSFTPYQTLNQIKTKVLNMNNFEPFKEIVSARGPYRFTKQLHKDHPDAKNHLSKGHDFDLSSNVFDRLSNIFLDTKPNDNQKYVKILGRQNSERCLKYIRADYIEKYRSLDSYKVFLPQANGTGKLGETLSTPVVGKPGVGHTETFLSIGKYDNELEAENTIRYIKTKFCRALLGVKKITQSNVADKWSCVPLQDFTSKSDIDWSQSIDDIDQQLYKKYGLSDDEINFIETHVKEMD